MLDVLEGVAARDLSGLVSLSLSAQTLPNISPLDKQYGIAGRGDSYYEYLLKLYLSTGQERYGVMLDKAMQVGFECLCSHLVWEWIGRRLLLCNGSAMLMPGMLPHSPSLWSSPAFAGTFWCGRATTLTCPI